ncbi:hypothetical protein JOC93_001731 [Priestia taiwanensis]|uniref:Uncharacterized protein n=1 Tax=Priestia taiwanensis TaxID=1347902 RepID=A0A917EQT1_9BACI|nr:hypothetical protein [Priestia taiwanensis]GGE67744.1 hypothetical protein GCM10007140_17280 [Priestia taiwanensis]
MQMDTFLFFLEGMEISVDNTREEAYIYIYCLTLLNINILNEIDSTYQIYKDWAWGVF